MLASGFRLGLDGRGRSNEKVPLNWDNRACRRSCQSRFKGTYQVKNSARAAGVVVSADGRGVVSQAGAVLLWETMRVTGLGRGLSEGLARLRAPRAVHDPGKVIADLAAAVALVGDCLADIAVLREQPALAGPVASDPVVSRLVKALAADGPRALAAIRAAPERAGALAGGRRARRGRRLGHGRSGRHDRDRAFGEGAGCPRPGRRPSAYHPMTAWADHGETGNGEPPPGTRPSPGSSSRPGTC